MKKLQVLLMMLFTAAILTSCGGGEKEKAGEQSAVEAEAQAASEDVAYACPMHPEVTGKKGDSCSKCGMELTEVEQESAESDTTSHDHH